MPGDPSKPCRLTAVKKISFGQSGVEIDTDLQSLFAMVNSLARCVAKIADWIEAQPGSSFAGGGASGTGSGTGPATGGGGASSGSQGTGRMNVVERITTDSDYTVPDGFSGTIVVAASSALNVTLCTAIPGFTVTLVNAGTGAITVKKPSGTTIGTLLSGGTMPLAPVEDNTNTPAWPVLGIAYYPLGGMVSGAQNMVFPAGVGPCVPDGASHLWQIGFATTGALNTTDLGVLPSAGLTTGFALP